MSTTGASVVTRMSLTSVAVSPASGDTEKPAPTTCATSWIVPPKKIPVARASSPSVWARIG